MAPEPRCAGACVRPGECPVQLLRPSTGAGAGPHFPSPVQIRVDRSHLHGRPAIAGEMQLAGRVASRLAPLALAALEATGRRGLFAGGEAIRFEVFASKRFDGTLRRWAAETFAGGAPGELVVELAEPCSSTAAPRGATRVDVARLAGETAYRLVRWDLEDRRAAKDLGEGECDRLASEAREAARASFAGVKVERCVVSWRDLGDRQSGTNPGSLRLEGNVGYVRLGGDLAPALQWLTVLALRGAGTHTSLGLGRIELWLPSREPTRPVFRPAGRTAEPARAILLLVGEQRIPSAISVLQEGGLREAILLSTDGVQAAADDLRRWLSSRGLSVNTIPVASHDYASLRASLATLLPLYEPGSLLVDVTGGTKVMSLAAADAAREQGHRAVYVDTQHGSLRQIHPDSPSTPLVARFRVEDFFLLHGQEWRGSARPSPAEAALARAIGRHFATAFDLVRRLRVEDGSQIRTSPQEEPLVRLCLEAGVLSRRGGALVVRDRTFFSQNRWLEGLAWAACEAAGCDDVAWRAPVAGTATDFDVVATKGPFLLVVSCKTGKAVKGDELDKLEAQARRVGGAFCRKLLLRVEAGDWNGRGGDAATQARSAFDARARTLGISTLYWEAFPRLAARIAGILGGGAGAPGTVRSASPR